MPGEPAIIFVRIWRLSGQLLWTAYLLLTSVYCLLAFFPYTYYALIKSPVYEWIPWFARQHAHLYWLALLAAVVGYHKRIRPRWLATATLAALALIGVFLGIRPILVTVGSGSGAYACSVAALVPALLLSAMNIGGCWTENSPTIRPSLTYFPGIFSAVLIAVLSLFGPLVQDYRQAHQLPRAADFERGVWSLVSHVVLAVLTISLLNLIFVAASRTPRPRLARFVSVTLIVFFGSSYAMVRFFSGAFGFSGWPAILYSGLLMATLICLAVSAVLDAASGIELSQPEVQKNPARKLALVALIAVLSVLALVLPSSISEWDWNGVFQWTFTILLWCSLTFCVYGLWSRRKSWSVPATLAVLLVTAVGYKILLEADVVWGKSLGVTGDEISLSLEQYGARDVSFRMAHYLLGNAPTEAPCTDFCRILNQYTNIRDAHTDRRIEFVDQLTAAPVKPPNIFMIVVDSMRPDYLGAYNPKADFTPNIDTFAADNVVMRQVFTEYAGTYLSEPAIWAGALLLHAHYIRPFENVNGLERLLNTDGYDMVISYDNVLPELLSDRDRLTKLDTDKKTWRALDFCSTVREFAGALDARPDKNRPLFFYAQPQNVHMFAANNQATVRTTGWRRPGFDPRISLAVHQIDGCLGEFLSDLKARGLYDDSIIILTSDHGDATGEFGRKAHSYTIYPEIMRVPLIVHLPESMRRRFVYDPQRITTLTDLTPSLYYLLGHSPVKRNQILGQPIFVGDREELASYSRDELFLASDEEAVYGLLDGGRYFYTTYASPARSFLFDLATDPNAEHNILTQDLKKAYDRRIIDHLKMIGDFYGYKLGIKAILTSENQ
jgi:arylsulfatase A-like enzyme